MNSKRKNTNDVEFADIEVSDVCFIGRACENQRPILLKNGKFKRDKDGVVLENIDFLPKTHG